MIKAICKQFTKSDMHCMLDILIASQARCHNKRQVKASAEPPCTLADWRSAVLLQQLSIVVYVGRIVSRRSRLYLPVINDLIGNAKNGTVAKAGGYLVATVDTGEL